MSGIEKDIEARFSRTSEERFTEHDLDCWYAAGRARGNGQVTATGNLMADLIAEIRRLRAENKELRASYERVEKYGQILLIETGELKDELSLWKRNADR